ncbi:MAG: DUF423 domain-containing protein [Chitinophagaceae bacterium]|nr:MAG: DUF423 domain-containing protein [Chitinophagaceae bacterium]
MHRGIFITACILAALSVALGAFAAHGLKNMISDNAVATFETGVRYQFYHVFALLFTAILYKEYHSVKIAAWLFIIGILLFSGSLYLLTMTQGMVKPGFKWVGPLTPIGGMFLIGGWIWMIVAVLKRK